MTLAAAGATAVAQSERSIETRKDLQSKERGLQERLQNNGIQAIDSPWLRCPRRSSFLQPLSANPSSIARSSLVLQCFRARKDDAREIINAVESSPSTGEFSNYVETHWASSAIETSTDAEANDCLDEIMIYESKQIVRYPPSNPATSEAHAEDERSRSQATSLIHHPLTTIAWNLHQTSIDLFTDLAPLLSQSFHFDHHRASILEDVGRLYLWGESFSQEQWAAILESSTELRSLVLELSDTLSTTLIEGTLYTAGEISIVADT